MEKHYTNLELSKQLQDNGFKKETIFWWNWNVCSGEWILLDEKMSIKAIYPYEDSISAPLATEILEEFDSWREQGIYIFNDCDTYFVQFREFGFGKLIKDCSDQFLPNALAKMWLYLKKEGLI